MEEYYELLGDLERGYLNCQAIIETGLQALQNLKLFKAKPLDQSTGIPLKRIGVPAIWFGKDSYQYFKHMEFCKEERSELLCLNFKNKLICQKLVAIGSIDRVPIDCDKIIEIARACGATKIILSHNHTSGDPTPSEHDLIQTEHLRAAAQQANIELIDHLVIGRDCFYSILHP